MYLNTVQSESSMIWSEKSQFNNYILQLHKVKSICQPIQEQHTQCHTLVKHGT